MADLVGNYQFRQFIKILDEIFIGSYRNSSSVEYSKARRAYNEMVRLGWTVEQFEYAMTKLIMTNNKDKWSFTDLGLNQNNEMNV